MRCLPLPATGGPGLEFPTGTTPVVSAQDSLNLQPIAQLAGTEYETLVFGDTDHDGLGEVAHYEGDAQGLHYFLYEHQGANTYSLEFVGDDLIPYAIGDLDRDGKAEVIGQAIDRVAVYESVDATSYPTELVWISPPLTNVVGNTTVADTDVDGKLEIIHSANTFGSGTLVIFENDGDNNFTQVASISLPGGPFGEKAIGDLDGNGIPNIALSGAGRRTHVLETTGDNTWRVLWTAKTTLQNTYATEIGPDLDGNGKPELFVLGSGGPGWRTLIYEDAGIDEFAHVGTLVHIDGFGGYPFNEIGNLTGSGQLYYFMQGSCCAWVYTASGPGQWNLASTLADDMHNGLFAVDVNGNGRAEIFWAGRASTRVFEHSGTVSDAVPGVMTLLDISPNPVRTGASIQLRGIIPAAGEKLCLYDATGRRLQEWRLGPDQRSISWIPTDAPAGVYFVQLQRRDGMPLARGRVTLVR